MSYPLGTLGERAWYAYQCLPRVRGRPPARSSLENHVDPETKEQLGREDGPSFGSLGKLFKGELTDPREETREKIARVLNVSIDWLVLGRGDPPMLTGPYKPMPRDEALREHDPEEWAKKYEAIGGVQAPPNNFRIAVLFYKSSLDQRAIEEVAKVATGRENDEEPIEWARQLRAAQYKHTGAAFDLARPTEIPGVKREAKEPSKRKRNVG